MRRINVRQCILDFSYEVCSVVDRLETIDGTAEAVKDYIPVKETLVFKPDETLQHVDITVVDDNEWEPDEVFFVKLTLDVEDGSNKNAALGKRAIQEITILNDDGQYSMIVGLLCLIVVISLVKSGE